MINYRRIYYNKEQLSAMSEARRKKEIFQIVSEICNQTAELFGDMLRNLTPEEMKRASIALGYGTEPWILRANIRKNGLFHAKVRNVRTITDMFVQKNQEFLRDMKMGTLQEFWFGRYFDFNVPYEEDVFLNILMMLEEKEQQLLMMRIQKEYSIDRNRINNDPAEVYCERISLRFKWQPDEAESTCKIPILYPKLSDDVNQVIEVWNHRSESGDMDLGSLKATKIKPVMCIAALWNMPLDYFVTIPYLNRDTLKYAMFTSIDERVKGHRSSAKRRKLTEGQIDKYYRVITQFVSLKENVRTEMLQKTIQLYVDGTM